MNIRLEGSGFAEVSRALKAAGEGELRKAMAKEAREIAKPVLDDMRRSVLALDSNATRSSGSSRARRTLSATPRRRQETEAAFAKRLAKNAGAKRRQAETDVEYATRVAKKADRKGGTGLRQSVARSLRISVRDTGYRVGVRVRVEGSRLPAAERYLPRGLDSAKGWRHPVFGGGAWVNQYGNPPGWFTSTALAHRPLADRRMRAVVDKYVKELAARIDRAA